MITTGSYCPRHRRQRQRERRKDPEQVAFYHSTYWTSLALRVRSEEPICGLCAAEGRTEPSTQVDHISGDYRDNRRENLRGICDRHHRIVSARAHAAKARGHI